MTAEDQIKTLRYYWHDAVAVAVFTNGTAVICKDLAHASSIMTAYDVRTIEEDCTALIPPTREIR